MQVGRKKMTPNHVSTVKRFLFKAETSAVVVTHRSTSQKFCYSLSISVFREQGNRKTWGKLHPSASLSRIQNFLRSTQNVADVSFFYLTNQQWEFNYLYNNCLQSIIKSFSREVATTEIPIFGLKRHLQGVWFLWRDGIQCKIENTRILHYYYIIMLIVPSVSMYYSFYIV